MTFGALEAEVQIQLGGNYLFQFNFLHPFTGESQNHSDLFSDNPDIAQAELQYLLVVSIS